MADNAKSYTPIDEDPTMMMMDRTNFIGAVLGGGAWGEYSFHARAASRLI